MATAFLRGETKTDVAKSAHVGGSRSPTINPIKGKGYGSATEGREWRQGWGEITDVICNVSRIVPANLNSLDVSICI